MAWPIQYRTDLNLASDVPIALWGMGIYAQDEWAVRPNLKLTLALRAEHNSNPVCQFNCFANFKGPFSTLASVTSSDPGDVPYSSDIATASIRPIRAPTRSTGRRASALAGLPA